MALSEAIVALFLLLIGTIIFATLLHTMLNHQARSRTQMLATWAAERRLAQVQAEAQALGASFYNLSAWNSLLAQNSSDPDCPGIELSAQVRDLSTDTPCSGLESPFLASDRRKLTVALKQVQITSRWGPGANQKVVLCSALAGPLPPFARIQVTQTAGPSPVPQNQAISFSAQAYDTSNAPIADLIYSWYCKPITGTATVEPTRRDGSTGKLTNAIRRADGSWISFGPDPLTGGSRRCTVRVRVRYRGVDVWGESNEIQLGP